ncbi:hypothetical protein B0H14DRAFT_3122674 [Mycena olivaceomarginata]|nr:hypothetical protein B0H14DRAFT_3122674 [Mycena olivaceomarginata]
MPEISPLRAAQLLDLPHELILLILGHRDLPSEALLSLSMLCRRLHNLALPLFFEIHGMEGPAQNAKVTMLDGGRDGVSALQMSLSIPAITKLYCPLPHYDTIPPLFSHIRRLRVLIARLAFVHEVTILLDTPGSFCGASGDGVETWALEFEDLLNAILKRGCTSLTLRYRRFFSEAYQLRPTPILARPVHAFRNAVRHILPDISSPDGDAWAMWQKTADAGTTVWMELDAEGCSASTLTHFRVESSILLIPPCFSWFISALRHSPLTTLEFFGVTLPHQIWAAVLPPIAALVPALTALTLSNLYGISGTDILLFLAKLPRLTSLTVGYTELIMAIGLRGVRHIGRSLSDIVHRLQKHGLSPVLSLEIQRGRDSDAEMAEDLALAPGEELLKSLSAITRLIVYNESSDLTVRELETLARWIARFPALLHVSLRVRGTAAAAAAHRDAWATLDGARTISEQNPTVRSLELDGTGNTALDSGGLSCSLRAKPWVYYLRSETWSWGAGTGNTRKLVVGALVREF